MEMDILHGRRLRRLRGGSSDDRGRRFGRGDARVGTSRVARRRPGDRRRWTDSREGPTHDDEAHRHRRRRAAVQDVVAEQTDPDGRASFPGRRYVRRRRPGRVRRGRATPQGALRDLGGGDGHHRRVLHRTKPPGPRLRRWTHERDRDASAGPRGWPRVPRAVPPHPEPEPALGGGRGQAETRQPRTSGLSAGDESRP